MAFRVSPERLAWSMSLAVLTLLAVAAPTSYRCADLHAGVTFAAGPGLNVTLRRVGEGALRLSIAGKSRTVPLSCFHNDTRVQIADYNFDGVKDVAVPEDVGYGGVNVYGTIYFTDAWAGTFRPSGEVEIGQSTPDPVRRVVEGGVKSGPAYSVVTNCFSADGWSLHPCRELNPDLTRGNLDDYAARWMAPDGRTLAERPFVAGRKAEEWTVSTARAFFHARPDAAARLRAYVVRGDRVEVIELRGDWARVAYAARGGTVTVGWLARASLR